MKQSYAVLFTRVALNRISTSLPTFVLPDGYQTCLLPVCCKNLTGSITRKPVQLHPQSAAETEVEPAILA